MFPNCSPSRLKMIVEGYRLQHRKDSKRGSLHTKLVHLIIVSDNV